MERTPSASKKCSQISTKDLTSRKGSCKVQVMGYRYDIKHKWDTDKWVVIDTKNRDMETGYEFDDRLTALAHAKKMDKGNK